MESMEHLTTLRLREDELARWAEQLSQARERLADRSTTRSVPASPSPTRRTWATRLRQRVTTGFTPWRRAV